VRVSVTIAGPLESALVARVGRPVGLPLTQVVVRALAWWVNVPGDLRRGDALDLLVEEPPGAEPELSAVRFKSGKTGHTHLAFRYRAAGARWPRLYQPDGAELELRLDDPPLDDYEQLTSLLRDGRGHKGIDFKTPTGTPVRSPFDGQVVRKNWNVGRNGNSLEVRESAGQHRSALFLHLSEVAAAMQPGASVTRGQVLGATGNTGHSFAPHLHYQLMSSTNAVLDPFASQATARRALPASEKAAFDAEARRLGALLDLAP
jgi:murein DD-endopeptidase MepM/ murein hydrolase activator NlpD